MALILMTAVIAIQLHFVQTQAVIAFVQLIITMMSQGMSNANNVMLLG